MPRSGAPGPGVYVEVEEFLFWIGCELLTQQRLYEKYIETERFGLREGGSEEFCLGFGPSPGYP